MAVVQRAMRGREPAAVMAELCFGPLELVGSFAVNMSGAPPLCMTVHAYLRSSKLPYPLFALHGVLVSRLGSGAAAATAPQNAETFSAYVPLPAVRTRAFSVFSACL